MEARHLRYFTAVAEELHFGRAARRLRMSQPALSKRIAEFEHELGAKLFTRTSKSVQLTSHGRRLLPLAMEALQGFDAVTQAMALPVEAARTLKVAFPSNTSPEVPRMLHARFAEWHIGLDWSVVSLADQPESLLAGRIDLGVLRLPVDTHGLWASPPLRQRVGVVTAPEHPLAGDRPIQLSALQGQTLLTYPRSVAPGPYDHIMSICIAQGFRPYRVKQCVRSYHTLMVQSELSSGGVMLAPRTWADRLGGGSWRPIEIEGEPLVSETVVCCRRGEEQGTIMQAAIHAALQALQEHDDWHA